MNRRRRHLVVRLRREEPLPASPFLECERSVFPFLGLPTTGMCRRDRLQHSLRKERASLHARGPEGKYTVCLEAEPPDAVRG